jgi:hypothetical protein
MQNLSIGIALLIVGLGLIWWIDPPPGDFSWQLSVMHLTVGAIIGTSFLTATIVLFG